VGQKIQEALSGKIIKDLLKGAVSFAGMVNKHPKWGKEQTEAGRGQSTQ